MEKTNKQKAEALVEHLNKTVNKTHWIMKRKRKKIQYQINTIKKVFDIE